MGQYTEHVQASYTFDDVYALIEMLHRVPAQGMLISLNYDDTQRMINWLTEAEVNNFLNAAERWLGYRADFLAHRDWLNRMESGRELKHWPAEMVKVFLVAWWTMIRCAPPWFSMFGMFRLDWARQQYESFAEVLDIELI